MPYSLVGLFGGAMADRVDRLRLLTITQGAMGLCAAALAVVVYARVDSVWVIDLIALIRGVVLVFNNPARQALMVELVGRGELSNAIALNSSLNNATRIVGPAIAGMLIATLGIAFCFALNALSFGATIIALLAMRRDELHVQPHAQVRTSILVSIRDGLAFARRTKTVAVVLTMLGIISTMAVNFDVVLPVLARGTLHGGPQTYGFITAFFGAGALTGALMIASRTRASRGMLLIAAGGFGVGQILCATQFTFIGVAISLYATGTFYTMYTASTNSLIQLATPGYLQGRVGGLYNYVFLAAAPLGSLIAGWLADRGGASLTLTVGGVTAVVMTVVGALYRPWPMPTGSVRPRRRRIVAK